MSAQEAERWATRKCLRCGRSVHIMRRGNDYLENPDCACGWVPQRSVPARAPVCYSLERRKGRGA